MKRIPFQTVHAEFRRVLQSVGLTDVKANRCAELFAENTRDGVYSHGLNRFPGFVRGVQNGKVRPDVDPVCAQKFGSIEQWDGQTGIGLLNAETAMQRAVVIAKDNGPLPCGPIGASPSGSETETRMMSISPIITRKYRQ